MPQRPEEDEGRARHNATGQSARFPEPKTAAIERPPFGRREKESPHPGEMECGLAKRRCGGMREEWEDEPPPNMRKGNYLPVSVVS